MVDASNRVSAVIAALTKIREHVTALDDATDVSTSAYNRWIGMLDGSADSDWKSLELDDDEILAGEYLMHLDAAIAFLEVHQKT